MVNSGQENSKISFSLISLISIVSLSLISCAKPDVSKRGEYIFKDTSVLSEDISLRNTVVEVSDPIEVSTVPSSDFFSEIGPINNLYSGKFGVINKIPLRPMPLFSPKRSTNAISDFFNRLFVMQWKKSSIRSPIIFDSTIVISNYSGTISAISAENYLPKWEYSIRHILKRDMRSLDRISLSYGNNTVFIATNNGYIIALQADSGELAWYQKKQLIIRAPVKYALGKLYGISSTGEFFIISAEDGKEILSNKSLELRKVTVDQPSVLIGTKSAIASYPNGDLIAFDLYTGEIKWVYDLAQSGGGSIFLFQDIDFIPAIVEGFVIGGSINGSAYLIREEDGRIIWTKNVTIGSAIAVDGEFAFFMDNTNTLVAMHWPTGEIKWSKKLKSAKQYDAPMYLSDGEKYLYQPIYYRGPIIASGSIILLSTFGKIMSISVQTGEIEKSFIIPYDISQPMIANSKIYAISYDEDKLIVIN